MPATINPELTKIMETNSKYTPLAGNLLGIYGAVIQDNFNDKQMALYDVMSDISQKTAWAGWVARNEYHIWEAIHSEDMHSKKDIHERIPVDLLAKAKLLSEDLGGWIIFVNDDLIPKLKPALWGPVFIPLKWWLKMTTGDFVPPPLFSRKRNEQLSGGK